MALDLILCIFFVILFLVKECQKVTESFSMTSNLAVSVFAFPMHNGWNNLKLKSCVYFCTNGFIPEANYALKLFLKKQGPSSPLFLLLLFHLHLLLLLLLLLLPLLSPSSFLGK